MHDGTASRKRAVGNRAHKSPRISCQRTSREESKESTRTVGETALALYLIKSFPCEQDAQKAWKQAMICADFSFSVEP